MKKPVVVTIATAFGFASVAFADMADPGDVASQLEAEGYDDVTVVDDDAADGFYRIEATDPAGEAVIVEIDAETGDTLVLPRG